MKNVSTRLEDDLVEELDEEAEEQGLSRSEYIRTILESRHEETVSQDEYERLQDEHERLRRDYEEAQRDVDRLQNQNMLILEQREEHTELVKQVEQERTLAERRASAGVVTRLKWWAVGMDTDG